MTVWVYAATRAVADEWATRSQIPAAERMTFGDRGGWLHQRAYGPYETGDWVVVLGEISRKVAAVVARLMEKCDEPRPQMLVVPAARVSGTQLDWPAMSQRARTASGPLKEEESHDRGRGACGAGPARVA